MTCNKSELVIRGKTRAFDYKHREESNEAQLRSLKKIKTETI